MRALSPFGAVELKERPPPPFATSVRDSVVQRRPYKQPLRKQLVNAGSVLPAAKAVATAKATAIVLGTRAFVETARVTANAVAATATATRFVAAHLA
jgi:hypothetical protein